jgi:pimeloyl-ACP methyl ester carboxylesterase
MRLGSVRPATCIARAAGPWLLLAAAACSGGGSPAVDVRPSSTSAPRISMADVGGYRLAYACAGMGSPTVILEAGYTASGIDTYGTTILPALARHTRVCTYDRAGDGVSDARPASVRPLTGATQARELHTLLAAAGVGPPYVLVGHSYGGMVTREFAALYPGDVEGMVLIDSSSEPEIPVYERLHAGAWIDGTVSPAPNQRIDIHATVRELERAPSLSPMPLVVITAGILEDQWLKTVPELEARAQTRLAALSTNSIHVLDRGVGHFVPRDDPRLVITATDAVVSSARSGTSLAPCDQVFRTIPTAGCLEPGELGSQRT